MPGTSLSLETRGSIRGKSKKVALICFRVGFHKEITGAEEKQCLQRYETEKDWSMEMFGVFAVLVAFPWQA